MLVENDRSPTIGPGRRKDQEGTDAMGPRGASVGFSISSAPRRRVTADSRMIKIIAEKWFGAMG